MMSHLIKIYAVCKFSHNYYASLVLKELRKQRYCKLLVSYYHFKLNIKFFMGCGGNGEWREAGVETGAISIFNFAAHGNGDQRLLERKAFFSITVIGEKEEFLFYEKILPF